MNIRKLCMAVAAAATIAVSSIAGIVLAVPSSTGLVAHWSYDQSSGMVLNDDSGNGHSGTFSGAPTWASAKISNGLTFDGTDNVSLGNITQINGVSKVTLAAWIRRSAAGAKVFVGKQASNQDLGIEAYSDGRVYFDLSKGSTANGSITLNDTAWHHVALVYDGTLTGNANRLKGYVDGVQKTLTFSGTIGTTTSTNTTPFNIGKMSGEYSAGQADDTWLYSRALSQAEVQDLMTGGATADTAAPTTPLGVVANAASQSQINVNWLASTDNVGVTGYRVYRDGVLRTTTTGTTFTDTGLTTSTTYAYTVRAYDAAGNVSTDSAVASATTQAPPAPTVAVSAAPSSVASGGSSTLSWSSTNATSCTASGDWSGVEPTSGSQVMSGLMAQSTYTLTCNGAGGQAAASTTVSILPPDMTVPVVSVTAPVDGASVSGAVTLAANATDDAAVANVTFAIDGVQQGASDTTAPYGVLVDTKTLSNGPHAVRATATDTSGNIAYAEVTMVVDNDLTAPTAVIMAPADGAAVVGSVVVSADATDNVGVAGVKFYAGTAQIGTEDTTAPYGVNWDTTTVANGVVALKAVARDAAGNTVTSQVVNVTVNNPVQTTKFITSVAPGGRYFLDQTGAPIQVKGDAPWAIFSDVSPADMELWAANREGHGFNAAIISLVGSTTNGGPSDNGATYDGILPFVGGNITSFNEAYWTRMDNYLTILKNHGITAFLYPMDGWNTLSGTVFYHKSAADSKAYGQMVATRYANYPNIMWMAGGDYNGYDSAVNTEFTNLLAGIRAAGSARPFSTQLNSETLSTDVATYEPLANWNFAYTYSTTYQMVLASYNRAASARDPRPVIFGEGNYEGEDLYGGPATTNETLRRQELWARTSGAAGAFTGSQDWQFMTGWQNRLNTTWVLQVQKLRDLFGGLSWQSLVPDEAAPLVTAGRGTKITASGYRDVLANDYVTAAQTPDKSQAVVYVPTSLNGASTARTITLNLARLNAGYTATWVDPTDATQSQPAVIDGSGNVTTPGAHSDGTRDWLLVIR